MGTHSRYAGEYHADGPWDESAGSHLVLMGLLALRHVFGAMKFSSKRRYSHFVGDEFWVFVPLPIRIL